MYAAVRSFDRQVAINLSLVHFIIIDRREYNIPVVFLRDHNQSCTPDYGFQYVCYTPNQTLDYHQGG